MKRTLGKLYARWMYRWETRLTTLDSNRIVRPVEWGFDWLQEFAQSHGFSFPQHPEQDDATAERVMLQLNDFILRHRTEFFAYQTPQDFVLEERHPQLVSHQRASPDPEAGCPLSPPGGRRAPAQGAISALYLARAHALSGERPRQCPLVSRSSGKDGRQAKTGHHRHAPVECRCLQPQRSLLHLQPLRRLRPAPQQALPRHSPSGRTGASRLRRQRQCRPHHRFLPPGRHRHSLLHRLA